MRKSSLSRPIQPAAQSNVHCRGAHLGQHLFQHLSTVRDVRGDVPNESAPAAKGQATHRSLKTRQTLPGCRAPLNANEEEHEGLWAARKSANHRGNLQRPRNGVCWRQGTLVSAGGYGVPSRRYRPPSLALASPGTSACTVSSVRSESCHMQPGVCVALQGAWAAGARACAVESLPCAAKRDHISKGVDDAERPNVPTWGGHGAQQALRHARHCGVCRSATHSRTT